MTRVAHIRFATYAILLICLVLPGQHRVISVRFPAVGVDTEWWEWPDEFHGGASPASLPGFADTRLAAVQIVQIALECVKKEKIDPAKLSWLRIKLALQDKKPVWIVRWEIISDPGPTPANFRIVIDDSSGKASFERTRS